MLRADLEEILVGKVRAEAGILHLEAKSRANTLPNVLQICISCDEALLLKNLEVCSGT